MFTIFAYKASSDDYCRGCHMASYDSDFAYKSTESRDEAVAFLVKYYRANEHLDINEDGYEITVLIDGKEPDGSDPELYDLVASMKKEAESLAEKEEQEAKTKAAEEKAAKEAAAAAQRAKEQEERDRKEFERLQKKFGSTEQPTA